MSEENDPGTGGSDNGGDGFKAITSQSDLDRIIGERVGRERSKFADYDDLKKKAAAFDEAENKNKTELQKALEERDAAITERDKLSASQLRLEVGASKGLTPAQARRLVGSTKEELEADADAFLADIGQVKKPAPKAAALKSGSSGKGDSGATTDKERAADLLREYRASSH